MVLAFALTRPSPLAAFDNIKRIPFGTQPRRRPRVRCHVAGALPNDRGSGLPAQSSSAAAAAARTLALARALARNTLPADAAYPSVDSGYPPAGAVEAALRALDAECAADLAYAALRDAPEAPPTWRAALEELAKMGLVGDALDRVVDRLGLTRVLALDPAAARRVYILLTDELELPSGRLRRLLIRRPALLEAESAVRAAIAFLYTTGLTSRDIENLAGRWPGLLTLDVKAAHNVLAALRDPANTVMGGSVRRFIRRAPFILLYDVESDIRPTLSWLHAHCLDAETVVRACPHILGTRIQALNSVRSFLENDIGLSIQHEFVSVVHSFPPILAAEIEHTLRPALRFLRVDLGIPREDVARIVHAFPATLVLDVDEEMRVNIEYFRGKGVENVCRIVKRLPPVLSYDLQKDIIPKMQYLENRLGLSPYDVLSFPAYFSYSLRERIEPRTLFLQAIGLSLTEVGLNMTLSLSDEQFCSRVALKQLAEYQHFCKSLANIRGSPIKSQVPKKQKKRLPIYEMF